MFEDFDALLNLASEDPEPTLLNDNPEGDDDGSAEQDD